MLDAESVMNPLVSPFYAEAHSLPPQLIITGSHELLHEEAKVFHDKSVAAGTNSTLYISPGERISSIFASEFLSNVLQVRFTSLLSLIS